MNSMGSGGWCVTVGLPDGPVCGSGILVDATHVVACAHTVPGGRSAPYGVAVGFPGPSGAASRRAEVVRWAPPGPNEQGNVAVLKLDGSLPDGARPAYVSRWYPATSRAVRLRCYCLDSDQPIEAAAQLASLTGAAAERVRLSVTCDDEADLCGAGVVDAGTNDLIGMVVAEDHYARTGLAWMISFDRLATYWPPLARSLAQPTHPVPPPAAPRPFAVVELALAVAELPTMSGQYGRDQVVSALPRQIATAVPRNAERRFDVLGIVRTCMNYPDGLTQLMQLLGSLEGDSAAMRQVIALIAELNNGRPG
jgi:hypothetical protein